MKFFLSICLLFLFSPCFAGEPARHYAVAEIPTPVLNTPNFAAVFGGSDGRTLKMDDCGLIRAMEFIALPGTVFTIDQEMKRGNLRVFRVRTADYPYRSKTGYYLDSRFVRLSDKKPPERPRRLPHRQAIIDDMLAARGSRYVWGGNIREGIGQMLTFFRPAGSLDGQTANLWRLQGVDCSGLLYQATDGFTPRNTSELIGYGKPLAIAGKNIDQIVNLVEPLDLIVWSGHVIIVLDRERTIESRLDCGGTGGGVVIRPLRQTLAGVMKTRLGVDDYAEASREGKKAFVIRRWYPY
ncbi:peptidoglycan endopeptidase [Geotalea sp. SG265]|uniref:peptidoglycan endopeptidase n=1 Tax=Geotalea sp. SG265 TaxID=2922867 RepID=UPI001FAEBA56|nr:peptidoglycan endopeptidase [Geotalea sp. SG265]